MSKRRFMFLSVVLDALFVNVSVVVAFLIRFGGVIPAYNFAAYQSIWLPLTITYLAVGWVYGLYEPEKVDSPWSASRAVATSVTFGTLIVAALAFLAGTSAVSFARSALFISYLLDIALLIGWRIAILRFFPIRWPRQRTLIIGTNRPAQDLARSCEERVKWGWNFVGFLTVDNERSESLPAEYESAVLGDAHDAAALVKQHHIDRLLVTQPVKIRSLLTEIVLDDDVHVTIDVVPSMYEILLGSVSSIVGDVPLMRIVSSRQPRYFSWIKRVIDIVGALILCVLTSPLWIVAGLAILIETGRPVFYTQERVGLHQKPFRVYKLRTMVTDAEKLSGPVLASEEDPRITRVGRVLRTYRIDELPQLINILQGTMSFIGPRPERPVFVAENLKTIPGYAERFRIKPGVTGLAQVNGGYATTPERKLKYDLMYLYHQSLSTDLQVTVETLKVVLTGRGAR